MHTLHATRLPDDAPHVFRLQLRTDAGTYIKEFVHGDGGRTVPCLADVAGAPASIRGLDVLAVHLDAWPGDGAATPPAALGVSARAAAASDWPVCDTPDALREAEGRAGEATTVSAADAAPHVDVVAVTAAKRARRGRRTGRRHRGKDARASLLPLPPASPPSRLPTKRPAQGPLH